MGKRIFRVSLLLSAFLGVVTPALWAQIGGLEGEVRDLEGQIMPGLTIEIERQDVRMKFEVKTDEKGFYRHSTLPAGQRTRYNVVLIRDGEVLFRLTDVSVPIGEVRRLDINLQEERKRQEASLTEEQKRQREQMRKDQEAAKSVEERFYRGRELLAAKQYEAAITEFEAAAALDPAQPAVFANLGVAYSAINQNEKAMEAYEKAIVLKPEEAGLSHNLGMLYAKAGRLAEAQKAVETAATLNPAEAYNYYYSLGVSYYNANNLGAAVDPLRKAAELNPDYADAHYWLGICLYSTAETKIEGGEIKTILKPGTQEAFEKYLALAPDGRYATEAKAMLEALGTQVPTTVKLKKK